MCSSDDAVLCVCMRVRLTVCTQCTGTHTTRKYVWICRDVETLLKSWEKPSASISATRCERRKFFIRFCFRKLFSSSFHSYACFFFSISFFFVFFLFIFFFVSQLLLLFKYLVHTRALRIVEIVCRHYCRMSNGRASITIVRSFVRLYVAMLLFTDCVVLAVYDGDGDSRGVAIRSGRDKRSF